MFAPHVNSSRGEHATPVSIFCWLDTAGSRVHKWSSVGGLLENIPAESLRSPSVYSLPHVSMICFPGEVSQGSLNTPSLGFLYQHS